ncbi:MAG: DUF6531 domain-containing protein [Syntrophobacteraceae bacterium]
MRSKRGLSYFECGRFPELFVRSGWKVLICGLALVFYSLYCLAGTASAYDAPPKDQGHTGPNSTGNGDGSPGGPGQGGGGDPVYLTSGNFAYGEQDVMIPGLANLYVVRYYNSGVFYDGPFGYGWSFMPFMSAIEVTKGSELHLIVKRGDGARMQCLDNGDGTYTLPVGFEGTLVKSSGGWTFTEKAGLVENFDASGKLVSITDRNGNALTVTYDGQGRIAALTDPSSRQVAFSYGSNGKVATVSDFNGRITQYGYDSNHNLTTVTDPLGNATTYAYDGSHRITSIVDAGGTTLIQNTYDTSGRTTGQTYGDGNVSFGYYPSSYYTQLRDRRGNYSYIYYSAASPNPVQIYDAGYAYTYMSYDTYQRMLSFYGVSDGYEYFTYDSAGNILTYKSPLSAVTTYTYDSVFNQVLSITDPLSHATTYIYDGKGNLTKITDALGQQTTFQYDAQGKLTKVTGPGSRSLVFSRSTLGYLTSITETVNSNVYTATFQYDAVGNVTQVSWPNGKYLTLQYDGKDRVTQVTDNRYSPARVYTYQYNTSGTLAKTTEAGDEKTFEYDKNRVTKINYSDGSSVSYAYNAGDLFATMTTSAGSFTYTYNNVNRLTKIVNPDASEINFTYSNDYLTRIQAANIDVQLAYTAERRLSSVTDNLLSKTFTFAYDAAGNRTGMTDAASGSTTYNYDALNRLTSMVDPASVTTTYSTPVSNPSVAQLNDVVSAYNFGSINRLITLIMDRPTGAVLTQSDFKFPVIRFKTKTLEANKRWHAWVEEETKNKATYMRMRSAFEVMQ